MLPDLAHGQDIFGSPELRTKMKILHAVDKSLDRITIAEICENAGISRQTFYRHFQSKYDIPWWHSIFCRQFYLNEIGRTIDWKTGYYHHLRLIAQELGCAHRPRALDRRSREPRARPPVPRAEDRRAGWNLGWLGAPTSCGRSGGGFSAAGAHHRSKNTFSEAIPCFSSDDAHHACGRCGKRFSGSA